MKAEQKEEKKTSQFGSETGDLNYTVKEIEQFTSAEANRKFY
jgi:hypothetical protein